MDGCDDNSLRSYRMSFGHFGQNQRGSNSKIDCENGTPIFEERRCDLGCRTGRETMGGVMSVVDRRLFQSSAELTLKEARQDWEE